MNILKNLPYLLSISLITTSCSHKAPPINDEPRFERIEPENFILNPDEFTQQLKELLTLHGALISTYAIQTYDLCSLFTESKQEATSLFENSREIGRLFKQVYGSSIGKRISELLNQHIELQLSYIEAMRYQDRHKAETISKELFHNGNLFIEFFNKINPYFPYEAEKILFESYLTYEAEQITAYSQYEYAQAEQFKRKTLGELEDLAIDLSMATISHFNTQYSFDRNHPIYDDGTTDSPPDQSANCLGEFDCSAPPTGSMRMDTSEM